MIERVYRTLFCLPVKVCWFNESSFPAMNGLGIHRFRQSNRITESRKKYRLRETRFSTVLIDLKPDISTLRGNLHRSHRQQINKVHTMMRVPGHLKIVHNTGIDSFVTLANQYISFTGYRKSIKKRELDQYIRNGTGELICIYADNELIAGHFYLLDYPKRVRVLYGYNARFLVKNPEKRAIAWITKYLHWYAISEYYKNAGFSWYDFGGIDLNPESEKRGIADFKKGFGGKIEHSYDYEFAGNKLIGKLYVRLNYKKEFRCQTRIVGV